jgi:hypothetical protein
MGTSIPSLVYKRLYFVQVIVCLLGSLIVVSVPFSAYASSSNPYDSGYDHGCNDAGILDPSNRYINQPEKGPSFHTDAFMQGYYDGFEGCTPPTNAESIPSSETGSFKIDATINLDRNAILDANGNNLGDAWFTINGQTYSEGTYYDMIDWVYDDDVEIRGINTNPLSRVLEIPYSLEPGQVIEVCLNDDKDYHVCKLIVNSEEKRPEKVNFTYP